MQSSKEFYLLTKKAYSKSYFEAARWLQIRSILYVCEDFADKADAKRALLYTFY